MRRSVLFVIVALLTVCSFASAPAQELSDPEKNFEHLWKAYDMNYAIFRAKNVDWQALYSVYRPMVTPETTEDELFDVMTNMLGHLNDNHVLLMTEDQSRFFCAGYLGDYFGDGGLAAYEEIMQRRPAPDGYFIEPLKIAADGIFAFGWLTDDIGYVHFNKFEDLRQSKEAVDEIVRTLGNAKAIVVDVRRNGGGDDRVGKVIADRFADRKRLYMTTQQRIGLKHDDFAPKKYWYVEPDGPVRFTKPVILLTDRLSLSAAENFALAMRVLPHVTLVGDFTSGCFADMYWDTLPNGWTFTVSYKLFLDCRGMCWEGIGVPPDIKQDNTEEDIKAGKDRVLELAIDLIESGELEAQDESESIRNIRESLSAALRVNVEREGVEQAVEAFRRAIETADEKSYYVDYDDLHNLGKSLVRSGDVDGGIDILELTAHEFPDMPMVFRSLGLAHLTQGKDKLAVESYDKSLELNPRRNPREVRAYIEVALEKTLCAEGFTAMARRYDELKNKYPREISESLLNGIGYGLLAAKRHGDAIDVLSLNVENHPEYANGYDSLGEAYMVSGEKKLAIENYEKSLELAPDNENAREMLKKLRGH